MTSVLDCYADAVTLLDRPRDISGHYAAYGDRAAITAVRLANGRVGFQCGPRGRIYAERAVALKHALKRAVNHEMDRLAAAAESRDYVSSALASEGA